jgi:hypothetical protein
MILLKHNRRSGMASNLSRSRKQFWEEHISRWSVSELSQVEYCRANKIGLKSFQYWKRKTKPGGTPALVELTVHKSSPIPLLPTHPQLCVVVNRRYRIEIGNGFDSEDLERVVRVLGRI